MMNRLFTFLFAVSCLTAVGQVPDYVPTEGLVAWYPFNGNAADESGNENDGVISGAILTSNRFDEPNSSFYFNGSAYIEVANSASISIPTGHDISWSVWLLSEPHSSQGSAFEKWDNYAGTSYSQLMLRRNANGDEFVSAGYCANPAQAGTGVVATQLNSSDWNHLVLITENLETQFFLNGELVATSSVEDVGCSNTNVLHIGHRAGSSGRYFKGKIDDFAIWNRALNADEVESLYSLIPPSLGCTEESACNFDPEASVDDGTCEVPGCTDPQACNFTMDAFCDGGICDYSCCPGPGCCDVGTEWSWVSNTCIVANPADINLDGCVQLNDLLDLLSAYGACDVAESPWQCGDPISYHGYNYKTVLIDAQCWFAENLRTSRYRSGDVILFPNSDEEWTLLEDTGIGGMAYPDESVGAFDEFGALYNWNAVTDFRQLCPQGWHIPTHVEWGQMENFAGMEFSESLAWNHNFGNVGEVIKSAEWNCPSWNGQNVFGFSALPAGSRSNAGYDNFGSIGFWWSSSSLADLDWTSQADHGVFRFVTESGSYWFYDTLASGSNIGISVRCIKDSD